MMRPLVGKLVEPYTVTYMDSLGSNKTGDIFETATTRMFLQGNHRGIMELMAVLFWHEAIWAFGFAEAQVMLKAARAWSPLPFVERSADIVIAPMVKDAVQPNVEVQR